MELILNLVLTSMCSTIFIGFCSDYIMNKFIRKDVVYFMMHVLLNTYIVSITYHNFITFILNPFSNLLIYDYYSVKSACVIIGFHIYHYLADDLDVETKIHHVVTVFLTGAASLMVPTGISVAAINFIMCGLPGGIDYFLLVLCKYKLISKLTEKSINRWLNLLIRMPFMMLCDWYIILNLYHGNITLRVYIWTIIGCKLMLINSIYYCNKTVGNYHVRFQQHKDKKTIKRSKILKSRSEADICKLKTN